MSAKAPKENETSRHDEDSAMNMKDSDRSSTGSNLGGFDRTGAVERHAHDAKSSAREGLQNFREAASHAGAGIGAAGSQMYGMAREQAGQVREAVQVRAENAYDQTCAWVRQSPMQALLLAAGAGMILGAFMLRR